MSEAPQSIALVGVGLIGGSVGLAARRAYPELEVRGYDLDHAVIETAVEMGAITSGSNSLEECVDSVGLCLIACPIGSLPETARAVLELTEEECVVTDVGSVKRAVTEADGIASSDRFIGGHPLAGAAAAGVSHARADLFNGAVWYLTPGSNTSGVHYEQLDRFIRDIGAKPQAVDSDTHDRLMASVSHLPHVLANVLVSQAASTSKATDEALPATGPSFRDMTRVAGSNPDIWVDIFLSNSSAIIPEVEQYADTLRQVAELLKQGNSESVSAWIKTALSDRQALLEPQLDGGAVVELRVSVPNKPGILAEIAVALGKAGVNIVDMALHPAPDWQSGAITLWVLGEEHATRAEQLVEEQGYPVVRIG